VEDHGLRHRTGSPVNSILERSLGALLILRTAENGDIRVIAAFRALPFLIYDMDQFFHFETMQSLLSQACAKHNCKALLVKADG
jgi:hypothetical protein